MHKRSLDEKNRKISLDVPVRTDPSTDEELSEAKTDCLTPESKNRGFSSQTLFLKKGL